MKPATPLFGVPFADAIDVLWIAPVHPDESFVLHAFVRAVPVDLAEWLATRGRTLVAVPAPQDDGTRLTYLTVDRTFDRAAAQELAAAWQARFHEPASPAPPREPVQLGESYWRLPEHL